MAAESTDAPRRRRLRAVVALPLVALALVVPFDVTARWTRRLSAAPSFSVSPESVVLTVALTLCLVAPLLWVGARTLAGRGTGRGRVGAYLYAVIAYLLLWPLGDSFGGVFPLLETETGTVGPPTHVDWPVALLDPRLLAAVLVAVAPLVGVPAGRRLSRLGAQTRERRSAARTADSRGDSPPLPERRALLGVVGAVGLSLLGGAAVGPRLSVDYELVLQRQVTFDFAHEAGAVTITHAGDGGLGPDHPGRLAVTVNGASRRRLSKPVRAGDAVTVAARPGDTVRVVRGLEGDRLVIGSYDVPRA